LSDEFLTNKIVVSIRLLRKRLDDLHKLNCYGVGKGLPTYLARRL